MLNFFDFTLKELETSIGALGKEKYRSRQLYKWVYNKGNYDFNEMSNIPSCPHAPPMSCPLEFLIMAVKFLL
jgi:adenine C2-methylase RlmN of 23S rRNA A2503 and tRNA A37